MSDDVTFWYTKNTPILLRWSVLFLFKFDQQNVDQQKTQVLFSFVLS